jgi:hypothetical protein
MTSSLGEAKARNFSPITVPGLPDEAREAVNAALKAMSTWRNETVDANGKNGKRVIEKMAAAAAALGWPEQIVEAARAQMLSMADMQIRTIDQMMDAWEEQLKLPNPMTASPSAILSKLKSLPGFGTLGGPPSGEALQQAAANPMHIWMQFAEQWQKSWADTLTFWSKAGKPH